MPTHNIKNSTPPCNSSAAFMAKKLEIEALLKRLQGGGKAEGDTRMLDISPLG